MAQDLTVNIKTTSEVPQAMEKAKAATVSFSKQIEDIQKKFSTAFKDIFLGFTAPMVLLQGAISYISGAMQQARQDAKEGLDLLAAGESRFAKSEEAKAAAYFKRKKELDEEKKLVESGRAEITKKILENENGMFKDFELPSNYVRQLQTGQTTLSGLAQDKEVQRMALEYFKKTDEGRKISESLFGPDKKKIEEPKKEKEKLPEIRGISTDANSFSGNVIGVGQNPVISAIHEQTEIAKQQLEYLRLLAYKNATAPSPNITDKGATPATPATGSN
jgi:hypothetical protein